MKRVELGQDGGDARMERVASGIEGAEGAEVQSGDDDVEKGIRQLLQATHPRNQGFLSRPRYLSEKF